MTKVFKNFTLVLGIFLSISFLDYCLKGISSPSDFDLFLGITGIFFLVTIWLLIIKKIFK